ncbi:MAG: NifB/NifX family molybdenum-iron cluster-binding protein [Bacteroidales bacterium]|nr:NifB/NifX family molybdenum-iron cluster-binding protein [Bacteroidales bacterium]
MRIAIPAATNKTDGMLDDRFGRCPYFCIFNTETGEIVFKENNHRNGAGGVGPQVSEFLAGNEVAKVFAVEVGPKAKSVLDKFNIQVQTIKYGQTIKQIIETINQ